MDFNQAGYFLIFPFGVFSGLADDRSTTRQDKDLPRVAAVFGGAAFNIVVKITGFFDGRLAGEDNVGVFGRRSPGRLRRTRLELEQGGPVASGI